MLLLLLLLLLLAATMVGRGRNEGGGSGGTRKGTGPKLKMDADSIAKRDKKAARKAAKESLATFVTEEKEKYESEMAWLREGRGPSTRSLSSRKQQPKPQAEPSMASAAAAASSAASSSSAAPAAAEPKLTLLSFFAKKAA